MVSASSEPPTSQNTHTLPIHSSNKLHRVDADTDWGSVEKVKHDLLAEKAIQAAETLAMPDRVVFTPEDEEICVRGTLA